MEAVVEASYTLHYIHVFKTKYASFSGRNIGYEVYKGIMGEELFKQKIEEFEKVQYLEENPRLSWILDSGFQVLGSGFFVQNLLDFGFCRQISTYMGQKNCGVISVRI